MQLGLSASAWPGLSPPTGQLGIATGSAPSGSSSSAPPSTSWTPTAACLGLPLLAVGVAAGRRQRRGRAAHSLRT
eukprot:CAMPEP_0195118748 /NCGR_PEP_ID=MMETSP0448-20130528/117766_1 /TAXON_ID=66468 /ORGANISM="Heterocapsa triquestra, Strain CCMP 448" /LENGTH=74 /DNA_ID=CAMNT_0040156031 /DNA_START=8 /DNA_END=229 /DNA_ORIENTATION=+